MYSLLKRLILILAMASGAGVMGAEPMTVVDTPTMRLEMVDGWLTRWLNKETGEDVTFGQMPFSTAVVAERPYAPGPWFTPWQKADDATFAATTWRSDLSRLDDQTALLVQSATRADGTIPAVQWSLRLPWDGVESFHFPRGLGPATVGRRGDVGSLLENKSYYFESRPAVLSFHEWRNRYFVVQGRTGGLLIYVDDTELEHRPALEFREVEGGVMVTCRSIKPGPWSDKMEGCRWRIRQYTGAVNVAGQLYRDYLADAYSLQPLADRPTGWVQNLAYCATKPKMDEPLPFDGIKNRRTFNYTDGWESSIAYREQWLDNLAKILNPDQVMFYTTGWNYSGMDTLYPNHDINPFFFYMMPKLRSRGYHFMLHFNATFAFAPSVGFTRFIENQWKVTGAKDRPGLYHCALRNKAFIGDMEPGKFYQAQGVRFPIKRYIMTPAYEPWRRIWVASVVSAIKSTGADMIHVDVPSIGIDLRNDLYGMNTAQGLREQFRLLRATLDENGLQHVAIATEVTPSEPILAYVDMAQTSRPKTIADSLDRMVKEDTRLIELQGNDEEEAELRAGQPDATRPPTFNEAQARGMIARRTSLGEASLDAMVMGTFVQGYPHLGVFDPMEGGRWGDDNARLQNHVTQAMGIWYGFTHDTMLHDVLAGPILMDKPEFDAPSKMGDFETRRKNLVTSKMRLHGRLLTELHYYKFALARFWQANTPQLMDPRDWTAGDIAAYRLHDGRGLRVRRQNDVTLRFVFDDGAILADLDVFEGWKNHDLLTPYEPLWLRDQIDEFVGDED